MVSRHMHNLQTEAEVKILADSKETLAVSS